MLVTIIQARSRKRGAVVFGWELQKTAELNLFFGVHVQYEDRRASHGCFPDDKDTGSLKVIVPLLRSGIEQIGAFPGVGVDVATSSVYGATQENFSR